METYSGISKHAFPKRFANEITNLNLMLKLKSRYEDSRAFDVIVEDQLIKIPCRIYCEETDYKTIHELTDLQRLILFCYFTRHHNGFVREKYLKKVIAFDEEWIIPYVIQLLSEYIREIHAELLSKKNVITSNNYIKFINHNKEFYLKTKQRVFSYWNCNYRTVDKNEYESIQVIKYIDNLIKAHKANSK